MEYYDVIIVGAGIAGCGLAYNLKRIGYEGNVLVLDKREVGANGKSMHRNTFKETIKEYNFKYVHKYKGVKISSHKEKLLDLNEKFYLIDYKKTCKNLFKRSTAFFRNEKAIKNNMHFLKTNNNIYKFKYLIDCSGNNFYLKKLLKMSLPQKYWIGKIGSSKNEINFDDNYFYYSLNENGSLKDFYPLKKKIMQGNWKYVNKIDFNLLTKTRVKTIPEIPFEKTEKVVIPCSPSFPLVYKNIAFLGDSFGNATPSAGEGIEPILKSSKLLANAILKNNLKKYEIEWKLKYLKVYLKHLALKKNMKTRIETIKKLKKNKNFFFCILRNRNIPYSKDIREKIPIRTAIIGIYNVILINLKYKLHKL